MTDQHELGFNTASIHTAEGGHPFHSHTAPIYQTSTFSYEDVAAGQAIWRGEEAGHIYSRLSNPNLDMLAKKITALEAFDLQRKEPNKKMDEIAAGRVFASGMAAITTTLLTILRGGDKVIAQTRLYGYTFNFLKNIAPQYGIQVIFLEDTSPQSWEEAFCRNPQAKLAYAESPSNPGMDIVELAAVAEIAHRYGALAAVDNTFGTPFCQRPLTLGMDISIHSTTKYLAGHGQLVGGAVISRHPSFIKEGLTRMANTLGGSPSPFDCWLTSMGMKTFALRMERHCSNAMKVAEYLVKHPAVARVHYPGLMDHPGYAVARRQMTAFGGILSFELKGGYQAGIRMMDRLNLAVLAVSLGAVDTLIQHPASMTHSTVSMEDRLRQGITEGLIRLSVGLEDVEDIIADLDQAMEKD